MIVWGKQKKQRAIRSRAVKFKTGENQKSGGEVFSFLSVLFCSLFIFQFPLIHNVWGLLTYLKIIHNFANQN